VLDPLILDVVEHAIGRGAQFKPYLRHSGLPSPGAQVLHYEQRLCPLPRDRDVMLTAIWALDDFTASNGATQVVPGSHQLAEGKPGPEPGLACGDARPGFINGQHRANGCWRTIEAVRDPATAHRPWAHWQR